MCGRARLSSDVSEIKVAFRIPPERPTPNFASWNVAPTDPLPVVRYDAKDHQRRPRAPVRSCALSGERKDGTALTAATITVIAEDTAVSPTLCRTVFMATASMWALIGVVVLLTMR